MSIVRYILKNWQYALVIAFVLLSLFSICFYGIKYGIDFKGGTLYQVELQEKISDEEMARLVNVIQARIDPNGFGTPPSPVGGKFILIQTEETNPVALEKIESRIRQQGKFEATLNGEIVFTGDELRKVLRGDNSFGVFKAGTAYEWSLPFVLNETAAKRFKEKTFHQCSTAGVSSTGIVQYECEKTSFFLDRPNALIIISSEQYDEDEQLLLEGNRFNNIPADTKIEDLIQDSMLSVLTIDSNSLIDKSSLAVEFSKSKKVIVSPGIDSEIINDLNSIGFEISFVNTSENTPWIWSATGAKQIISLTEGITNENVDDISQAEEFSTLRISGQREVLTEARADLEELAILLESGSLPTPVKNISRETISASLGKSFLDNIFFMGVLALIIIAGVIFIRYRSLPLTAPIFATILAETLILIGILSLPIFRQPFDLAAFAGLIAALGSGVNAEIVIVDELMNKTKRDTLSLLQRVKEGLFIITTSAITMIGVMGPIVLLSKSMPGLSGLYGFAVVAILGAIIGVLITRPAFTKIVEMIVHKKEENERNKQ